ncbi:MAG: LysM peptidoglycan-binding domain-containing protein [Bacillota bacterium]|nr:LysM peptidoglycan-binding domain-containing protein [Bacillota bacterium]MDW7683752.1 LysM peptidoglycan-binding domain-containing protein [Bacillota bacterium]
MSNEKDKRAMHPVNASQVPPPPQNCDGQFYTVRASDTLFSIAKKFNTTTNQILTANPQIVNPNIIFVGQVICIPDNGTMPVEDRLRVLSLKISSLNGQTLLKENGFVQLNAQVRIRATFSEPVDRVFFFLEPTGTQVCELARLIGVVCPGASTAELIWQVPPGTSGRIFVVGCTGKICAKSKDIAVVRE